MADIRTAVLVAIAVLTACSSKHDPELGAPTVYDVSRDGDFDHVSIGWFGPAEVSTYAVEYRRVPGSFREVARVVGVQTAYRYLFTFPQGEPEVTDHEFRVRAYGANGATSVSAASPFHRGVRDPALDCVGPDYWTCEPSQDGVRLSWSVDSLVADRLSLQKRVVGSNGDAGPWTTVPVGISDTSWLDANLASWQDGVEFEYLLAVGCAAEWSAGVFRRTTVAHPVAPEQVTAEAIAGAVRVSYVNRSTWANKIVIRRRPAGSDADPVTILFGPAPDLGVVTTYDDVGVAPGAYEYTVYVGFSTALTAPAWFSQEVRVVAIVPQAGAAFRGRLLSGPPGPAATRLPSGDFAYGTVDSIRNSALVLGADVHALPFAGTVGRRGLVTASDGRPHSTYLVPDFRDLSAPVPIVHAWHDGSAWRSEELRRIGYYGSLTSLDAGLDGKLRATWSSTGSWPETIELATLEDGGWVIESVSAALSAVWNPYWSWALVSGDEAGQPHLLLIEYGYRKQSYAFRDGAGWHLEDLTCDPELPGGPCRPLYLFAGQARTNVVAIRPARPPETEPQVVVLTRGPEGWSAPESLGVAYADGSLDSPDLFAARSSDGARLLVAVAGGPAGPIGWTRNADATTTTLTWFKHVEQPRTPFVAGFGADGKAWILDWLEAGLRVGDTVDAVLFEEP